MRQRDFNKVQDLFIFFKNLSKLRLEENSLSLVNLIYQNLTANTTVSGKTQIAYPPNYRTIPNK